jgi:DNA recombination protein RmuC
MEVYFIVLYALICVAIGLIIAFRPRPNNNLFSLSHKLDDLFKRHDSLAAGLKGDFKSGREESQAIAALNRKELIETLHLSRKEMQDTLQTVISQNRHAIDQINKTLEDRLNALVSKLDVHNKENREMLTLTLKEFAFEQKSKFDELKSEQRQNSEKAIGQLERIQTKVEQKLEELTNQAKEDHHRMRDLMANSFRGFQETFDRNVEGFNNIQKEKFGQLEEKQARLIETTEKRLDQIRETVEERLQKTLQERLGQSFDMVSKQLNAVQQGLGEMQTLAQDVGGLKRVLSNVKMRGGFGEVQLQMLLENILAPEQYEANVNTKKGTGERVEFAVKFPNKEGDRDYVWLPIDAKFPKEAYEQLQNAYDGGDHALIELAQKNLEIVIKRMARDICEKYIDAPNTTNFGIMFLPFEGLFAEVVRKASLLEEIQRDCKVIITGPTTLAVILNSLQMGFRTLAIQKRSSQVWQVLGAVKKEFNQFGSLLEKAQNNIQTGLDHLENVVGVRTRQINRKLKDVEILQDDTELKLNGSEILNAPVGEEDE